jgi:hypothetical protein
MLKKKNLINENKTISVEANKMSVVYTDTNKHYVYKLENQPTREIVLFGKTFKGQEASKIKEDFLNEKERAVLNDILYSKDVYTPEEIKKMPLIRQYYLTEAARRAEQALYNWKREIINSQVDSVLMKLFPNSKTINKIVEMCKENQVGMDVTRIDIRNLVSEKEIVTYLQNKGIFPKLS